ncbi:DUF1440 domain-containing protein [Neolewinella aurantiaca]|uniref:DUF1440 domain-containing protein n=1 Tax=Neolewinella aurantiaca TaxID=2602767 RepID=A0A5C7FY95_9BACT|nr:DUF1440 domain-containing protein [Neolewinella aurantiaca]TXF91831.1 DUF1440 domain-containing protein [Neolewinella aurantiaca]
MKSSNFLKGALCGFAAGVAATIAKTVWEEYFPVRDEETSTPPVKLAERISGKDFSGKDAESTSLAIHGSFGVGTGIIYGAAAEVAPVVTSGLGLPFGLAFYGGTHGSVVPLLDLEPWPTQTKREYAVNEFVGHLVYAATLEIVRRGMRQYVLNDHDFIGHEMTEDDFYAVE